MEIHPIRSLKEHLKKLAADLKPMTFVQKLDHLWTYYKWVLVVLAVIICIISIISSSVANLNKDILISGMLVNTKLDADGHDYLTTGYFEKCQGVEGKQETELTKTNFNAPDKTEEISLTYNSIMRIVTRVSAQQLDYVITDEVGLEVCLNYDILMDLNELLTKEELASLEEDLIYIHYEEEDVTIPVAINLRNQKFSEKHIQSEGDTFIAFAANTLRLEGCRDFWEYLQQAGE